MVSHVIAWQQCRQEKPASMLESVVVIMTIMIGIMNVIAIIITIILVSIDTSVLSVRLSSWILIHTLFPFDGDYGYRG